MIDKCPECEQPYKVNDIVLEELIVIRINGKISFQSVIHDNRIVKYHKECKPLK